MGVLGRCRQAIGSDGCVHAPGAHACLRRNSLKQTTHACHCCWQHAAVLNTSGPHPIVYGHWFHAVAADPDNPANAHILAPPPGEDAAQVAAAAAAAAHEHSPPDIPTYIIYGHYDVQPVEPVALWVTCEHLFVWSLSSPILKALGGMGIRAMCRLVAGGSRSLSS